MEKQEEQKSSKEKSSRLKIIIIILSLLLVLSAGGLVARVIYLNFFAPTQATTTVPDNLIGDKENPSAGSEPSSAPADENSSTGESSASADGNAPADSSAHSAGTASRPANAEKPRAPKLELYQGKPGDNEKFEVRNMFPGDTETKYYCVKAYHDADITLYFNTEVTEQTKALGDVLHIKVTRLDTGKVLCDAPFSEINGQEFSELLKKNADEETTAYYRIDVSLDTSVGNEYQAALLKADFNWYVKGEGGLVPPPQTGDTTNIMLWVSLALSSLLLMILLLMKRRKESEQHER